MSFRSSKFSKSPVRQESVTGDASAASNGSSSSVPAQAGGAPADAAGFFSQMKSFFTGDKGAASQPATPVGLDQFAHFGNNNASPSQPGNPNGAQGNPANGAPPNANPATGSQSGQPNPPGGGIDPAQLMAAVGNMNFAQAVAPELTAKALSGEADSGQALMQIINQVGQNAFAQSTLLTNNLVNQRLADMQAKIDAGLGDKVTNLQRQEAVTSNPMLQHPALAPIKNALTTQFTTQYANETPQAIQKKVNEYMTSMAGFLQTQMAPTETQKTTNKHAAWQADALDF